MFQNVPGNRPDRGRPRPRPPPRGPVLLRAPGERGQVDELPAEPELAAVPLLSLRPASTLRQLLQFLKLDFLTKSTRKSPTLYQEL